MITERIYFHQELARTVVRDSRNIMLFLCFLLQLLSLKEEIFFPSDLFNVFYVIYDEIKILVFFLLKAPCSLSCSFTLHIFWHPKHFLPPSLSPVSTLPFSMFSFVLEEQNTSQSTNLLLFCNIFSKVKIMAIPFFHELLQLCTAYCICYLGPFPAQRHAARNVFVIQSIILMTFLPRGRERQRERGRIFCFPASSFIYFGINHSIQA